ncbi:hypothetical protein [Pseudomonas sp. UBA6323]|uniref:hypothetical protein n=1 Tax=Pseudomonas sp. UBA6323 TaxID=1947329 RepID=UPI0025E23561|nr:hypothetical protein [Pseudomonas sp. UBA6323]
MTSKTLYGSISVTVGETEYELEPTLHAVRMIEQRFGGLLPTLEALRGMNVDAVSHVIVAGASLSTKEARDVPEAVFAAGVADVTAQVVPFVVALLNPADAKGEEESGNTKKTKAKTVP